MSLVIELPIEMEKSLEAEAKRWGAPPETIAIEALRLLLDSVDKEREREAVYATVPPDIKPFVGILNSGRGDISTNVSEYFAEILSEKRRMGTL